MMRKILFCLFLSLFVISCSDKEDNKFYSYSLPQKGIVLEEALISKSATKLINSEQEFKEFTHSEKASGINFSKQTLIVVYGFSNAGIDKVTNAIEQHDDKYLIAVDVFCNLTLPIQSWSVAYIVPKLTHITKVEAHVEYKQSVRNK